MPCMLTCLVHVPIAHGFGCLHDHVGHLAHMPRLHYIGMHALPLELSMIEVELIVCLCTFHSILKMHTWFFGPSRIEMRDWWSENQGTHPFES